MWASGTGKGEAVDPEVFGRHDRRASGRSGRKTTQYRGRVIVLLCATSHRKESNMNENEVAGMELDEGIEPTEEEIKQVEQEVK